MVNPAITENAQVEIAVMTDNMTIYPGRLTLTTRKYFCIYHGDRGIFFPIDVITNILLAPSSSFKYICHRPTAIINGLLFPHGYRL